MLVFSGGGRKEQTVFVCFFNLKLWESYLYNGSSLLTFFIKGESSNDDVNYYTSLFAFHSKKIDLGNREGYLVKWGIK